MFSISIHLPANDNISFFFMGVQVPLEWPVSHCFGYIPKSGTPGSYGRLMFRFLRSLKIFFPEFTSEKKSYKKKS
jgi:hypothetical protein